MAKWLFQPEVSGVFLGLRLREKGPALCPVSRRAEPREVSQQKGILAGWPFQHTVWKNGTFDLGTLDRACLFIVVFVLSPLDVFSRDTAFDPAAGFEGQRVPGDKNDTGNLK